MFAVALTELGLEGEEELAALAAELQMTAYDLRLRLGAGLPAVLMTMPSREDAAAAWQVVRSRGHGALLCDLRDVVPGTSMVPVRRFVLEEDGLRADQNAPEVLPYRRMQVLVHVAHSEVRQIIGHEMVYVGPREGVQRRETVTQEHDAHESLYIFRSDGGQPWIVRERDAHYAALGSLVPVRHLNFLATIAALRARAPTAYFDDHLAAHPRSPAHFSRSFGRPEGGASPWADHGADVAAHILAAWIAQSHFGDPYRSPAG